MRSLVQNLSVALAALALVLSPVARAAPAAKAAPKKNPVVVMKTNLGTIKVELDQEKAPLSVENFLKYADDKFYDGTVFHRVIDNFMVQGGGMTPDLKEKATRAPIKNEARNGLKNLRGTIAMARTNAPDSATSQFYINVIDNGMLDFPKAGGEGYSVFGKVVDGMDVVDKIRAVKTGNKGPFQNVPVDPVVIESVRREK